MKVLITGVTGFIGSHLANKFKSSTCVLGVARKNGLNVNHLVSSYDEVINLDTKDNIMIHLASPNTNLNEVEIESLKIVKKLSSVYKDRMIFISSAAVYGDNVLGLARETSNLLPKTAYAKNKILCEKAVIKNNGIVLRLSNVYGNGMSQKNIFYEIFNQLQENKPKIQIYNSFAIRDFIYVEDVCSALEKITKNPRSGIYNICTGIGTSIKDLAKIIIKHSNNKIRLTIESKEDKKSRLVLDPDLTRKVFFWNSKISLSEGLMKIVY